MEWWSTPHFHGCGVFILSKKISNIKKHLKHWAKFEFESIKLKKLELLHELDLLNHCKMIHSLTEGEAAKDSSLRNKLYQILKQEEIY